ncbi:MAG: NAD(+)/NADH kinase [Synergistaceae bacterium]|jgi:NAD+ kinase|nr:NAD(+)/NADH kinase [Synergistaceae bacterium]
MAERVVGLFFKRDRDSSAMIAERIKSADYGARNVRFFICEPGDADEAGKKRDDFRAMEFAVSIGGDGTFMRTAGAVREYGVPLYGVNAGRLGFLASGNYDDAVSDVKRILSGRYRLYARTQLRCELSRAGDGSTEAFYALNEFTLSKGPVSRPIGILVTVRREVLYRFLADGIIVSTPTGSTAYSLSAGGPLVHPDVKCVILTPVCPHSLYHRPFILGSDETVEISLEGDSERMTLSGDGILNIDVKRGDLVKLSTDEKGIDIIALDNASYFETLTRKLHWRADDNSLCKEGEADDDAAGETR